MLEWLRSYDIATTWADVAGLVGFAITIAATLAAKSAAKKAQKAAENARDTIHLFDTVVDFQAVISALEEVKRLHREKAWLSHATAYLP